MTRKLLIVDDFPVFRVGLKVILSDVDGLEVVGEAESGRLALIKADQLKPDLVVMDLNMPFMHGIEAIRCLKQKNPDIKVLALAEQGSHNYLEAAIEAGASGYVLKEDSTSNLLYAIGCVLDGYLYLSTGGVYSAISESPVSDGTVDSTQNLWRNLKTFRADRFN